MTQAENPDEVRQSLAPVWRLQVEALLRQHPEAVEELRAVVARVQEELPGPQQTWVQTNVVRDQATQSHVTVALTTRR